MQFRPRLNEWEISYAIDCIDAQLYHYDGETKERLRDLRRKLKGFLDKKSTYSTK